VWGVMNVRRACRRGAVIFFYALTLFLDKGLSFAQHTTKRSRIGSFLYSRESGIFEHVWYLQVSFPRPGPLISF